MKKTFIGIGVTFGIAALALILAINFLTPSNAPAPLESKDPSASGIGSGGNQNIVTSAPEGDSPIKEYDNGIATFTYDSTKLFFDEMPSDNTDGIPQTWFFQTYSNAAIPSVAVFPLILEKPFSTGVSNEDWEGLAKAHILSFFSPDMQGLTSVKFSGTVVKVEGETAKMYLQFDCDVASSPENNINGVVRLVADSQHAIITVAVAADGQSIPAEMTDTYMSVSLNA